MKTSSTLLVLAVMAAHPASAEPAKDSVIFKPGVTYVDLLVRPGDARPLPLAIQTPPSLQKLKSWVNGANQEDLGWNEDAKPVKPAVGRKGQASGDVEKLLKKIEKEGQLGKDPQSGADLKGIKPSVETVADGQIVRAAILKGAVDASGRFTHDTIMTVEVSQTATGSQVSPKQRRTEEIQTQTMVVADAAGKAQQMMRIKVTHTDLYTAEDRAIDAAAKKEYAAELAVVQAALGAADVAALTARISKDGLPTDDAKAPAIVLPVEVRGGSGDAPVAYVIAIRGEYKDGATFTPVGLALIRQDETAEVSPDKTQQKSITITRSYTAGLDGTLQEAQSLTKLHHLSMQHEQTQGADAQAAFDAVVKKLVR